VAVLTLVSSCNVRPYTATQAAPLSFFASTRLNRLAAVLQPSHAGNIFRCPLLLLTACLVIVVEPRVAWIPQNTCFTQSPLAR